ncbi:uncharacterized protein LOC126697097 isoform X2 [Quercus robur]|uniref:uncharacterized protein LOC126697097 isoform X2 n=1 Tax=Quercus robur TaxID=38942 RepID=UPI00216188C9|nr:uncharacterized protein LOC126697097 isoform X2 [Quercus robur]
MPQPMKIRERYKDTVALLLARSNLLIIRNIEWNNLMLGFDQSENSAGKFPLTLQSRFTWNVQSTHYMNLMMIQKMKIMMIVMLMTVTSIMVMMVMTKMMMMMVKIVMMMLIVMMSKLRIWRRGLKISLPRAIGNGGRS